MTSRKQIGPANGASLALALALIAMSMILACQCAPNQADSSELDNEQRAKAETTSFKLLDKFKSDVQDKIPEQVERDLARIKFQQVENAPAGTFPRPNASAEELEKFRKQLVEAILTVDKMNKQVLTKQLRNTRSPIIGRKCQFHYEEVGLLDGVCVQVNERRACLSQNKYIMEVDECPNES